MRVYVRIRPFGIHEGPIVEDPPVPVEAVEGDQELDALVAFAAAPLVIPESDEEFQKAFIDALTRPLPEDDSLTD